MSPDNTKIGNGIGWGVLGEEDLADLVRLGRAALAADGGLPLAGEADFLRGRYLSPGAATVAARDSDGKLVAAGAVRPGEQTATCIGQVSPEARARGLGAHLLDWALAEATVTGRAVVVESETLTSSAQELFASRGLRRFFAEDVMGIDPTRLEPARWAAGTELVDWADASAPAFHSVYEAAFRERPGFPGLSAQEWITDTEQDDGFRSDWSVLACRVTSAALACRVTSAALACRVTSAADVRRRGRSARDPEEGVGLEGVGFVTAAAGWILQVGVVPSARGAGLGAALIRESLGRMRAEGATRVLLTVNVDNPAARLYEHIGFTPQGRRGRFRLP